MYLGETSRNLRTRFSGHMCQLLSRDPSSPLCKHSTLFHGGVCDVGMFAIKTTRTWVSTHSWTQGLRINSPWSPGWPWLKPWGRPPPPTQLASQQSQAAPIPPLPPNIGGGACPHQDPRRQLTRIGGATIPPPKSHGWLATLPSFHQHFLGDNNPAGLPFSHWL